jgi:hypothetical protein
MTMVLRRQQRHRQRILPWSSSSEASALDGFPAKSFPPRGSFLLPAIFLVSRHIFLARSGLSRHNHHYGLDNSIISYFYLSR